MSPELVRVIAQIAACNARIEGMKAHNSERESNGLAQAYSGDEFFYEANELYNLANIAINTF